MSLRKHSQGLKKTFAEKGLNKHISAFWLLYVNNFDLLLVLNEVLWFY